MILITHGIIAVATARIVGADTATTAFIVGFVSHFISDAFPHWHYEARILKKMYRKDRGEVTPPITAWDIFHDGGAIAIDGIFGLALPLLAGFLMHQPLLTIFWAVCGGLLPDALQVAYYLFPKTPLAYLQRFHKWIHAEKLLDDFPVYGIGWQTILSIVGIAVLLTF